MAGICSNWYSISESSIRNPFSFTLGSAVVTVTETNHGRSNGSTVCFRNVDGSPGGLAYTVIENAAGFVITVINTNSYSFNCGGYPPKETPRTLLCTYR